MTNKNILPITYLLFGILLGICVRWPVELRLHDALIVLFFAVVVYGGVTAGYLAAKAE